MTPRASSGRAVALFAVALLAVSASCGASAGQGSSEQESLGAVAVHALGRAVSVETTACGFASKTSGAGVILGDGSVLTAAHVVIGATDLTVTGAGIQAASARILRLDTQGDLAVLDVPGVAADPVTIGSVRSGDTVTVIGGGPSGALDAAVIRGVEMRIEGVRSTERISRIGYELDTRVQLGDSGSGVFDVRGRLVGVVYGRTQAEANRTFVAGAEEIMDILEQQRDGAYACDPTQHKVVRVEQ